MTSPTEQIAQLKAAMESLEAQRSTLGDVAVDTALGGFRQKLTELEKEPSPTSQIGQSISHLLNLGKKTETEGERRQATILFSDLSGYTAMSEKLDPEEVEGIMNRVKEAAIQIIERHEGTVNQFVGDEVVALFGIPHAHEDDPSRAVKSALELHDMVRQMSEEVEPLIGHPLTMHSGINTGLIVTAVRDDRDGKYGLTGDSVNIGARLLAQAKADEILVSPAINRLIIPYFRTESLEPVHMKGKTQPMVPHRILGKTPIQTHIEAAEQKGFTPYTGREEELATLNACLEKSLQGEGQFVTVTGEAGLGKSRLLYEFRRTVLRGAASRHKLDHKKITVIQSRCQSYGVYTPYLPLLDALRRGLHLDDEDSPAELHEKAVSNILKIDPALEKYLPVYLHILSIPSDSYPLPEELSGEKLKKIIQEALATINTLITKKQPMVLILEDWHWADEASDATLIKYLEIMASYPLLIVLLYRPEYASKWGQLPFHTSIDLTPVNEKSTEAMIQAIYRVESLPEGMASIIFQRTGGNPFFVEELCDLMKDQKTVLLQNKVVTLSRPIEQITFPASVQAVIRTKLDRLSSESKEVMRLASVIGREFQKRILEHIIVTKSEHLPAGGIPKDLTPSLENLKASDLIRQIEHPGGVPSGGAPLPEMTYQFNHVITQEVTYETLLFKQRTLLHRLVAETIEALYAERLEEQFEVLAYHYSKSTGGRPKEQKKALYYLELAGDKAARNFSLLDARTYYKDAMDLADEHQMTVERKRKRVEICLKWAQISHSVAPEETFLVLETSLEYARELNDEPKIAHLNYWLGQRNNMIGNFKQAMEHFSDCTELAEQWNEKALLAQAYPAIGIVTFYGAEYTKTIEVLEKGIPVFQELDKSDDVARTASVLCGSYGTIGDFEKALAYGEQAIKITKEMGNLSRVANSYMWLGVAYLFQGNWEKCIESENQAIKIAQPLGDVVPIIIGLVWLGYSLFMNGNREEGLLKMQEGVEMVEASKIYLLYPQSYGLLAYCCAQAGMVEKAKDTANKCLEWTPKGMRGWEYLAYYALALAEAQKRPSTGRHSVPQQTEQRPVDQTIEKGLRLCQERGQSPLLAQGYFEYAKILSDREDQQKAQEYLNQATELFTEMKMTWWLEQAKGLGEHLGAAG